MSDISDDISIETTKSIELTSNLEEKTTKNENRDKTNLINKFDIDFKSKRLKSPLQTKYHREFHLTGIEINELKKGPKNNYKNQMNDENVRKLISSKDCSTKMTKSTSTFANSEFKYRPSTPKFVSHRKTQCYGSQSGYGQDMKDIDLKMHNRIQKINEQIKDPKELKKNSQNTLQQMNENVKFGKNKNCITPRSSRNMVYGFTVDKIDIIKSCDMTDNKNNINGPSLENELRIFKNTINKFGRIPYIK